MASPDSAPVKTRKTAVIVPTYNGGAVWCDAARALAAAVQASEGRVDVLVVDSSSSDDTVQTARDCGFAVHEIPSATFDHGGTRNQAARMLGSAADIAIFLTQDAILTEPGALDPLIEAFDNADV
ncbi:MAG TPA: glycosyltransferase, partial [Pseudonocardia sp.]|uniref:glycosyltransferase family 2 protein n=1 Tax=Pseudonocardia sp. TaxID=60912 RepID=UPI002B4B2894